MVKCPMCPKKFPSHHGLGGHLSGPCGLELKAKTAAKTRPPAKVNLSNLKQSVEQKLNTTVTQNLHDALRTIRAVSLDHKKKAAELDKVARSLEAFV